MSQGYGWVEREIIDLLSVKGPMPVISLAYQFYNIKKNRATQKWTYQSVCRAVRKLEKDKQVKTEKWPVRKLDPNYKRYWGGGIHPTYVKMVFLDPRE